MTVALFITCTGDSGAASELGHWFRDAPATWLRTQDGVERLNVFEPELGDVPLFSDGVGPPLIAQVDVRSNEVAQRLISQNLFDSLIMRSPQALAAAKSVHLDVFEVRSFPISPGGTVPARQASLSFVVRYHRPTPDPAAFAEAYIDDHPPQMMHFPGIRNILCYVSHTIRIEHAFTDSGAFFGNEVVFDDLKALNAALGSSVLPRLKAGRRNNFKPFGHNTHHAMVRESI